MDTTVGGIGDVRGGNKYTPPSCGRQLRKQTLPNPVIFASLHHTYPVTLKKRKLRIGRWKSRKMRVLESNLDPGFNSRISTCLSEILLCIKNQDPRTPFISESHPVRDAGVWGGHGDSPILSLWSYVAESFLFWFIMTSKNFVVSSLPNHTLEKGCWPRGCSLLNSDQATLVNVIKKHNGIS
jgi:hypothetical protein